MAQRSLSALFCCSYSVQWHHRPSCPKTLRRVSRRRSSRHLSMQKNTLITATPRIYPRMFLLNLRYFLTAPESSSYQKILEIVHHTEGNRYGYQWAAPIFDGSRTPVTAWHAGTARDLRTYLASEETDL